MSSSVAVPDPMAPTYRAPMKRRIAKGKCGAGTRLCTVCLAAGKTEQESHRRLHGPEREITDHPFTAKPCAQPAMQNGRCQYHGGKSLEGVAHPRWSGKGETQAMVLPARMHADYQAARNDPSRLSLEAEIAELRALRMDVWRMLDKDAFLAVGAVHAAAADVHKHLQDAFVAHKTGNAEKFATAMNGLGEADAGLRASLSDVMANEAARSQAADLIVKIDKLVKTENSRIFEERGMVSLEAALADRQTLVLMFLAAMEKHVREPAIQKAIRVQVGSEYARLTGRRDVASDTAARGPAILDAQHSSAAD